MKNLKSNIIDITVVAPDYQDSSAMLRAACDTVYANAIEVGGGRFARISCDLLRLEDYQRREKGHHVNKIARNWDEAKCLPLSVAYRDGAFFVVDGQHRLAAARLLGKPNVKCIINRWSYEDSCGTFIEQDDDTMRVSAYAKLWAGAKGNKQPFVDILNICKEESVKLVESTRPEPGKCGCASKIIRIYNRYGRDCLTWVFHTIRDIGWSASKNGYSGDVLTSLADVWGKCDRYTDANLTAHVKSKIGGDAPNITISKAHAKFIGRNNQAALTEYLLDGTL